jgi:hypothetical protein
MMETLQNETLVSIPNVLLNRTEVQNFFDFLEKNTSKKKNTVLKTRDQFEQLFQTWKSETALLSSATAIINHAAYQKIIQMGEKVLPFMFIKLQNDPQHLFYALYTITGENPVPLAHAGNFKKMTADWLNWAAQKGYINA